MTTQKHKDEIFDMVERGVTKTLKCIQKNPDVTTSKIPGLCMYYALIGGIVLKGLGFDPKVQGGTMTWPCGKDEDGPLYFSYLWTEAESGKWLIAGVPVLEIHSWLSVDGEVVDFCTRHLPFACKETARIEWTAPAPPRYVWMPEDTLPAQVVYKSYPKAEGQVMQIMMNLWAGHNKAFTLGMEATKQ